jgi:hypothetical protein
MVENGNAVLEVVAVVVLLGQRKVRAMKKDVVAVEVVLNPS